MLSVELAKAWRGVLLLVVRPSSSGVGEVVESVLQLASSNLSGVSASTVRVDCSCLVRNSIRHIACKQTQ